MAQPLSRGGENEIAARIVAVLRKHLSELTANSLLESALEKTGLSAARLQQADVARLLPALERGARLFMRSQADAEEAMKGLVRLTMARDERPVSSGFRKEPPATRRTLADDPPRWSTAEPPTARRSLPDDGPVSRRLPPDDGPVSRRLPPDDRQRGDSPHRRSMAELTSAWGRNEASPEARSEPKIALGRTPARDERRGDEHRGDERRGDERRGDERRGDERRGDERRGDERRGEERRGELAPVAGPPLVVDIRREEDIVRARSEARRMAERLGATVSLQTQLATVVSELARNIFLYAGGKGLIELCPLAAPRRGVDVVARDQGPGIADVALVLGGNYRSKLGMGLGLRGVRRLATYFELNSVVGVGTTVRAQLRIE